MAATIVSPGQASPKTVKFKTLVNFNLTNGASPAGPLVQGTDGSLYGTTNFGGANNSGTVFRLTPSGKLTTIYNFCSLPNCADGWEPSAALVLGTDGNLYGITEAGGTSASTDTGCPRGSFGCGTMFQITPTGTLKTIYNWCSQPNCADGYFAFLQNQGSFVQAHDGNFYGANSGGGANFNGTVFKLTPSGLLTTLHTFCSDSGCSDGALPSGLIQGIDGNFYGTTYTAGPNSWGTVFRVTAQGSFTTLYAFCSQGGAACTDGGQPAAPLVQAADGNLYGSTDFGGNGAACVPGQNCGTLFKISLSGALTTVYDFCSQPNCADGGSPSAPLVQATDGNFYGTTNPGVASGNGGVFEVTPMGALALLYSFDVPLGPNGVIQETNGKFYGTTLIGGPANPACYFGNSCGMVFQLSAEPHSK